MKPIHWLAAAAAAGLIAVMYRMRSPAKTEAPSSATCDAAYASLTPEQRAEIDALMAGVAADGSVKLRAAAAKYAGSAMGDCLLKTADFVDAVSKGEAVPGLPSGEVPGGSVPGGYTYEPAGYNAAEAPPYLETIPVGYNVADAPSYTYLPDAPPPPVPVVGTFDQIYDWPGVRSMTGEGRDFAMAAIANMYYSSLAAGAMYCKPTGCPMSTRIAAAKGWANKQGNMLAAQELEQAYQIAIAEGY